MAKGHVPRNIRSLITRFDNAAQNYAFKGSLHPDDWEECERRYKQAREALEKAIFNAIFDNTTGVVVLSDGRRILDHDKPTKPKQA